MSPIRKKTVDEIITEERLNLNEYSTKDLKANIENRIEAIAHERYATSSHATAAMLANIGAAIINQNEKIIRQNEQIIHLLQGDTSGSDLRNTNTCSRCNAVCGGMAFCSQCGCKLRN